MVVAVTAVARRFGLLAPILLVVVGLALSFVPDFPVPQLDPELVIVGILPPLLYVAALEISVPAFKYNLRPILQLAVGHVLFIAAAVGLVVHVLLPRRAARRLLRPRRGGRPAGRDRGDRGGPPDRPARRMVVDPRGREPAQRRDRAGAVPGHRGGRGRGGDRPGRRSPARWCSRPAAASWSARSGAIVFRYLHQRTTDPLLDNALSLLTPFVVAVAAESVDASGVVAVVVTGLYLGHRMPTLMSAALPAADVRVLADPQVPAGGDRLPGGRAAAARRSWPTCTNRPARWSRSPPRCWRR